MKKTAKTINNKKAIKARHGITKTHVKRAMREHHYLGQLIGAIAKGIGMAAPHITRGVGMAARGAGAAARGISAAAPIGKVLKGAGTIGSIAQTGLGLNQMRQAAKAATAQERLLNAQAQAAENQNAYFDKQMAGSQPHKKGGRAKSYRKNYR